LVEPKVLKDNRGYFNESLLVHLLELVFKLILYRIQPTLSWNAFTCTESNLAQGKPVRVTGKSPMLL